MQVNIIASGSKGNATYVEMDGTRFLIDVGVSASHVTKGLAELAVESSSLAGILLTHEHIDHVRGLINFASRYRLPIFGSLGTLNNIERSEVIAGSFQAISGSFRLGEITVEPFPILHDAAEPVGYKMTGSEQLTFATDLGFVTDEVQQALEGADIIILEANHDPDMLKQGSYPWALKRRILSNRGHLANNDAAWALARLKKKPEKVYLAHLSEENNRPELAEETVTAILAKNHITIDIDLSHCY